MAEIVAKNKQRAELPPREPKAPEPRASHSRAAGAAGGDTDISVLELDVEILRAELEQAHLNENAAETKKLTVALKVAELKLTKQKLKERRS